MQPALFLIYLSHSRELIQRIPSISFVFYFCLRSVICPGQTSFFRYTSKETMSDKIKRMLKNKVEQPKKDGEAGDSERAPD